MSGLLAAELASSGLLELSLRRKRLRNDSQRGYDELGSGGKSLKLDGVIDVLKKYNDYDGGINCSICGKLYKSRVCFIKHIWEHSVYWDQFDGVKNHERVLSIQAALILYSGYHGIAMDEDNVLTHLLVTAPNHGDKKDLIQSEIKQSHGQQKKCSPLKRKKSLDM
ncbi:hypothetical protein ScPMuIL_017084 [Solemya velum]